MDIKVMVNKIQEGYKISREEALKLVDLPLEVLLEQSKIIMNNLCDNSFDFCTIINAKSGRCTEDCSYCSQSIYQNCHIEEYDLLNSREIIEDAITNYNNKMNRYSIVTSGKRVSENELEKLLEIYKKLNKTVNIKTCASLGLLKLEDFIKLKKVGLLRYHNNLETSKKFFKKICTTHTYEEKIISIKDAQKAGLSICSGGIIGLGETFEDRINLAIELREIGVDSIPLNLLNPIKGTPLENNKIISEEEFYRTCAIFRFIHPDKVIRLAGGRNLLKDRGKRAFETCINGAISGNFLTTYGNDPKDDIDMVKKIGYEIREDI